MDDASICEGHRGYEEYRDVGMVATNSENDG